MAPSTIDTPAARPTHILLAEDSPTQRLQLKYILEQAGYQVTTACNGVEALERMVHALPDLLISDVVMPQIDGYQLCRLVRQNATTQHLPVLLLTYLSDPEAIINGLDCGANLFLIKPYEDDLLLSHVKYAVQNAALRQPGSSEDGVEVSFHGRKHRITSDRVQILDLLFSAFDHVLHKAKALEEANRQLSSALETIKQLQGILPICAWCKKIRDDKGSWQQMEHFIQERTTAQFTHGLCPDCATKHFKSPSGEK